MAIEGNIAKNYWQCLSSALPDGYRFAKRSRRPAEDIFNAALNYLYGMLYNVVSRAVMTAGLDTHLGILHADAYNKPTFTFDMIEPFRPWIDQLLVKACLTGKLLESHFDEKNHAFTLNKSGKQYLIPLFNGFIRSRSTFRDKRLSRLNHINRFAGEFAQKMLQRKMMNDTSLPS